MGFFVVGGIGGSSVERVDGYFPLSIRGASAAWGRWGLDADGGRRDTTRSSAHAASACGWAERRQRKPSRAPDCLLVAVKFMGGLTCYAPLALLVPVAPFGMQVEAAIKVAGTRECQAPLVSARTLHFPKQVRLAWAPSRLVRLVWLGVFVLSLYFPCPVGSCKSSRWFRVLVRAQCHAKQLWYTDSAESSHPMACLAMLWPRSLASDARGVFAYSLTRVRSGRDVANGAGYLLRCTCASDVIHRAVPVLTSQ